MIKIMDWFERIIVYVLIVLMMLVILLGIGALGIKLFQDFSDPGGSLLDIDQLLDAFGYILFILIGVELLDTVRAYLLEHVVHVEIVLEVALIAIARKVIILGAKEVSSATLLAIAALVVALAVAFYLEKRSRLKLPERSL